MSPVLVCGLPRQWNTGVCLVPHFLRSRRADATALDSFCRLKCIGRRPGSVEAGRAYDVTAFNLLVTRTYYECMCLAFTMMRGAPSHHYCALQHGEVEFGFYANQLTQVIPISAQGPHATCQYYADEAMGVRFADPRRNVYHFKLSLHQLL